MQDTLGLIRVGIVTDVDPSNASCRVTFDDLDSDDSDGLLSDWLPVLQHGSLSDAGYWIPRVGSQVACAMQSNGIEAGYVLGAIYNDEDTPVKSGQSIWYQRFADGTAIEYDPDSGITLDTPLNVVIHGAKVEINS